MDEVANKILQLFIRLVRKEMSEYEEDEKQRCELYHQITNNMKSWDTDVSNYVSDIGK